MTSFRSVLALPLALALSGCITVGLAGGDEDRQIRFHTLDGSVVAASVKESSSKVLKVREFEALQRYEPRVVRRTEDQTLEHLEFERWADEPTDAVTIGVWHALATSGLFDGVLRAGSDHAVDLVLDGFIQRYDLVRTASGPWQARFSIRFDLADARTGKLLNSRTVDVSRELPGPAADGLGRAMGQCVSEAVRVASDRWLKSGALD